MMTPVMLMYMGQIYIEMILGDSEVARKPHAVRDVTSRRQATSRQILATLTLV